MARVPVYPALIVASLGLSVLLASAAPLSTLVRPLAIGLAATIAVQLVASAALRSRGAGGLVAALVFLLAFDQLPAVPLVGAALAGMVASSLRDRRLVVPWASLTTLLNLVTTILLVIGIGRAVTLGAVVLPSAPAATGPAVPGAPDIYLLMLDGYPRADTLLNNFDFDNGPFLDEMRAIGFAVSTDSHSNYTMTALSLASLFNHRQVQELVPDPPPTAPDQFRRLEELISDAAGLREARAAGYEIVAIPSPFSGVALHGADRYLDSGQLNEVEVALLQRDGLQRAFPGILNRWVYADERARIDATFGRLASLANEGAPRPRLVFAHVMAPHPPIVYHADGSPAAEWSCFPRCGLWNGADTLPPDSVREASVGQITHINTLVVEAVQGIVASSARPVAIVVFSDHGFRRDPRDVDELFRNLLLTYTPGQPGLFPSDATPINMLPRLLNAYAGLNLELAPEDSFVIPDQAKPGDGLFPLTIAP